MWQNIEKSWDRDWMAIKLGLNGLKKSIKHVCFSLEVWKMGPKWAKYIKKRWKFKVYGGLVRKNHGIKNKWQLIWGLSKKLSTQLRKKREKYERKVEIIVYGNLIGAKIQILEDLGQKKSCISSGLKDIKTVSTDKL